jgi:hypothetical protein
MATQKLAVASQKRTVSHFLVHQRILDFDTIDGIEAESQALPNFPIDHDFPNNIKIYLK